MKSDPTGCCNILPGLTKTTFKGGRYGYTIFYTTLTPISSRIFLVTRNPAPLSPTLSPYKMALDHAGF